MLRAMRIMNSVAAGVQSIPPDRRRCPRPWRMVLVLVTLLVMSTAAHAQMPTSVKFSLIRAENPKGSKAFLILPYAFSSETMGLTGGVGAAAKGYGQDQLLLAATVFGSVDDFDDQQNAAGAIAGMWDLRIPKTERFFFGL